MIAESWGSWGVPLSLNWTGAAAACPPRVRGSGPTCPYTASAQLSEDRRTLYLRVSSSVSVDSNIRVLLRGKPLEGAVNVTTLNATDVNAANSPADPEAIRPHNSRAIFSGDGWWSRIDPVGVAAEARMLPANSFSVFSIEMQTLPS